MFSLVSDTFNLGCIVYVPIALSSSLVLSPVRYATLREHLTVINLMSCADGFYIIFCIDNNPARQLLGAMFTRQCGTTTEETHILRTCVVKRKQTNCTVSTQTFVDMKLKLTTEKIIEKMLSTIVLDYSSRFGWLLKFSFMLIYKRNLHTTSD